MDGLPAGGLRVPNHGLQLIPANFRRGSRSSPTKLRRLTWRVISLVLITAYLTPLTLTSGPQGLVKANQPRFDSGLTPVSLTCGPHTSGLTLDSRVDPLM